ncbi:hypothetical protein [Glycomyces buryatensis]|uniref:Uncharacterized protein n=1 Tax=Glycomyces buryatensis TaxID=2570927 RepID=A0A4S8Q9M6_9ACTN|nr:hypothetical protein [Glycomyces buryatensis]THV40940.1 hypothetical protein FAB82_13910 [Glycomyces buryatensis]
MDSFYAQAAPWGRPVVDDIPMPPFTTAAGHDRFTRLLQLHVALIDNLGQALSSKMLSNALEPTGPRSMKLTRLELEVAMATFFPAPWTPGALSDALHVFNRSAPNTYGGGKWIWESDPHFIAEPRSPQGWEVERGERGRSSPELTLETDSDLVLLWMTHFTSQRPYPYGWSVKETDVAMLAEAAQATRDIHGSNTSRLHIVKSVE